MVRLTRAEKRLWLKLVAYLKSELPCGTTVRVRTVPLSRLFGSAVFGVEPSTVYVSASDPFPVRVDTLLNEYANVLSGEIGHNDRWALSYARLCMTSESLLKE